MQLAGTRIIYAKFVCGARAWQNAKCRTENAKRPHRWDTTEPREKEKPGCGKMDGERRGTRYAASGRVQPIGNQHQGLCNLSNCSLCYFLLSSDRRPVPFQALVFPSRFLARFSSAPDCRIMFRELPAGRWFPCSTRNGVEL